MELLASQEICTAQIDLTGSDGEDYLSTQGNAFCYLSAQTLEGRLLIHKKIHLYRLPVSMTGWSRRDFVIIIWQAML